MKYTFDEAYSLCEKGMQCKGKRKLRTACIMRFLLQTGLRESQLRGLKYSQTSLLDDGKNVQIRIESKSGKVRHVYAPRPLYETIRLLFKSNTPYIFSSESRGGLQSGKLNKSNLHKTIKTFAEVLGYSGVSASTFRKACLDGMLRNREIDNQSISEYLGIKLSLIEALRIKYANESIDSIGVNSAVENARCHGVFAETAQAKQNIQKQSA